MNRKTLAAAFPLTLPVLMGYLAIGVAFGLMLQSAGWGVGWAALMSLTIYAGSGQYLGVSLLAAGAPLTQVAFLTLMVNFRTWSTACPCWRNSGAWACGSSI